MPFLPPMTGNGKHTTYIFMVMTEGWFMALFYPQISNVSISGSGSASRIGTQNQNASLEELLQLLCCIFYLGGFPLATYKWMWDFHTTNTFGGFPSGNLICQMDVNVGFSIDRFLQVLNVGNGWVAGGCWDDY